MNKSYNAQENKAPSADPNGVANRVVSIVFQVTNPATKRQRAGNAGGSQTENFD